MNAGLSSPAPGDGYRVGVVLSPPAPGNIGGSSTTCKNRT